MCVFYLNTGIAITTVGYGEITPRSFLGRILTVPLLVCGLLLIALPSFVLGREFATVWEEMALSEEENTPLTPSLGAADVSSLLTLQNS